MDIERTLLIIWKSTVHGLDAPEAAAAALAFPVSDGVCEPAC